MPKLKDLLKRGCTLRQGDWVYIDGIKGIYISSVSEYFSIIATYTKNKPTYKNINTNDMIKIKQVVDGRLFKYAKKHIMWLNKRKKNAT